MAEGTNGSVHTTDSYEFQMDGVQLETLKSVSGVEIKVEALTEHTTDGKGKSKVTKYAGMLVPPSITIVRGMSKSDKLTEWLRKAGTGPADAAKVNVSIIYKTSDGKEKTTINLTGAWVSSWSPGDLNVGSSAPIDETFVIECDEVKVA
ncbi:phage tail protein [Streptomyces lavendulae]|uniref:phage tail protein n=1 Tax=Streptomyces lavendulae TaxID=1914 RepID=UPI0036853225